MRSGYVLKLLAACFVLLVFSAGWALAAEVTITGEVNDNYQIVADGQIYEIADTEKGNDLAENYISAKVQVQGTIDEENDMKIITVTSFKVLSD